MDHPFDGPWTYRAIDNLALHPGKTNEVTIELIEGVLVEGKVAEAGTGKPIVGISVGMYGPARPRSGAAIMSTKTDDQGRYRFRLPPGNTYLYISSGGQGPRGSQSVVIPSNAKSFTAPTIEVRGAAAARPAALPARQKDTVDGVAARGLVCDVSDEPVSGALVVGAIVRAGQAADRKIVRADARGRFSLALAGPKGPNEVLCVSAFKEGLAPATASVALSDAAGKPAQDLKLILARTRPFVGVVQNHHHAPIAGAEVRVQSMKVPVSEGAGTTVTEVPWAVIHDTPVDNALRTTTDERGAFRFPSAPARSLLNLVVTAKGMAVHRTSDFAKQGTIGPRPLGFDEGFLHGSPDAPAKIYLAPEVARNAPKGEAEVREKE
jgi:hypothetical protein